MDEITYVYFDESGDDIFPSKEIQKGKGSKNGIFSVILAKNPVQIVKAMGELKLKLLTDPEVIKELKKRHKTLDFFHASDDIPLVRKRVFNLIKDLDFTAGYLQVRKSGVYPFWQENPEIYYRKFSSMLLRKYLYNPPKTHLILAKKTKKYKVNQKIFDTTRSAFDLWKRRMNYQGPIELKIDALPSISDFCLQVVDYIGWAVFRKYESDPDFPDLRWYNVIKHKFPTKWDEWNFLCKK